MRIPKPKNKMENLILHVCKRCEGDATFGAVKLNKILFYADFLAYFRTGESITGERYFALEEGPAPRRLFPLREQMRLTGKLEIQKVLYHGRTQLKPVAKVQPEPDALSPKDLELANEVIKALRGVTGKAVSNASHEFKGWCAAMQLGEKTDIPYATVGFDESGFMKGLKLANQ